MQVMYVWVLHNTIKYCDITKCTKIVKVNAMQKICKVRNVDRYPVETIEFCENKEFKEIILKYLVRM